MSRAESDEGRRLAEEAIGRYAGREDRLVHDLDTADILRVLKVAYIADRFFGKSRSWLCHKLNGDMVNGKPSRFTDAERAQLKNALDTIAYELQILSDKL